MTAAVPAGSTLLADPRRPDDEGWKNSVADGVSFRREPVAVSGDAAWTLVATNAGKVPRNAAWARMEKTFEPSLNLAEGQALSVEIEGDGSGAVLVFRLESPAHLAYGAVADRHVVVDFTGRRRITLVETESSRWSDFVWNDASHLYHAYRETVSFGAINSLSLWLQNLAPGRETKIGLGSIRALPLRAAAVTNPKLSVGGQGVEFPIALASGSWIECNGPEDCLVYGPKGEALGKVTPRGTWPEIPRGTTLLKFSCGPAADTPPRARVTVFHQGDELPTREGAAGRTRS
jgi:hypothetical protein